MCHMIVGGWVSQSVVGWGGGSRSPQSGLLRVGLRERGHFGKLGLGLVCSCHRFGLSGVRFPDITIVLEGIVLRRTWCHRSHLSGRGMSRRLVMSRTGFHGTCRALVSAHARSMCGESVLCWALTKQDVLLNVNTTRILKCLRKDSMMLFMIIRSMGGTEGTIGW